jgi:ribosomal protein S18 acetylase RimI-like enzyme
MEGKIVYTGTTLAGKPYVIRYPQAGDAQMMTDYINILSREHTFIRFQGEKITFRHENKYLNDQLKKIAKHKVVQLLIISSQRIAGITEIGLKDKTESHEGRLGITLAEEFRDQGIGKILMASILREAQENLPGLRHVTLEVFANNPRAQHLYQKFGFQEFGRLPEGVLHNGKYIDLLFMVKR